MGAEVDEQFFLFEDGGPSVAGLDVGGPWHEFGQGKRLPFPGRDVDVDARDERQIFAPVFALLDDGPVGAVELELGVGLGRRQFGMLGRHDLGHGVAEIQLQLITALRGVGYGALEMEQVGGQRIADGLPDAAFPGFGRRTGFERAVDRKGLGGAEDGERPGPGPRFHVDERIKAGEQPRLAVGVQELIIDDDHVVAVEMGKGDVLPGKGVLLPIPAQHPLDLAAGRALDAIFRLKTAVDAEPVLFGIIPDVAGLDEGQILPVVGVGSVPARGHDAPHPAVVERKRAEMLGDQDDRKPLALVRTEGPGRHDPARLETIGPAQVVKPRNKIAVPHQPVADLKIAHQVGHGASFEWCVSAFVCRRSIDCRARPNCP